MKTQPAKKRTLRFIMMVNGYVESASTGCLIYSCGFFGHPGYDNYKDAITNLALDLYAKFYDDYLSVYQNRYSGSVGDCCRKVLNLDKGAKFCSTCGKQISDKKFDYEKFKDYVCNLTSSTCDNYGDAEDTSTRQLTWWPWWVGDFIGAPKEDVIFIAEQGEVVLLAALLEAKPELKNPGDEETDFSFCEWDKFKRNEQPAYR